MSRYKNFLFSFGLTFLLNSAAHAQYIPLPQDETKIKSVEPRGRKFALEFRGNFCVNDERIRAAANLDQVKEMNSDTAAKAAQQIEKLYHDWGYTLAKVSPAENPEGWTLSIDEGVLQSILIYGAGWYDTVILRSQILPFQVFHVPTLEQGLARWLELRPGYTVRYELSNRPVSKEEQAKKAESIIQTLMKSDDRDKLKNKSPNVLLIYIERAKSKPGLDFGLGYSSANKLEFQAKLTKGDVFTENDWSSINFLAGLAKRSTIDPASDDTYYYSNIGIGAKWFSPKLPNISWLRLTPGIDFLDTNEQRPDLPLDRYHILNTSGEVGLVGEWSKYQYGFLSMGYSLKHAAWIDAVPSNLYTITDSTVGGFRLRSGIEMIFSKPRTNRLLNDTLEAVFVWNPRNNAGNLIEGTLKFHKVFFTQKIFYIMQVEGIWQEHGIEYFDEIPINDLGMSASFSREIWLRRGINVGGEARYNLWGSQIQAALFSDVTTFGNIDRTTGQQSLEAAFDIGPAIYITLIDAFQFSVGYSTGFSTIGLESYDLKLGFDKIF